jgi:CDP-6-deoxy-D-xylo-4-hexulose-3-dehydrase
MDVVRKMQAAGIECRPMIAGNFVHHPVIKHLPHSVAGVLRNADHIHENAIYIGNHHFDLREQIDEAAEIIRSV